MSLEDEGLGDIRVKKGPSLAYLRDKENPVCDHENSQLSANSEGPDQMLHSEKSDLGLHCLPKTCFGVNEVHVLLTDKNFKTFRVVPYSCWVY